MKKGNLFVYSGPSGVGKGTILDKIMEEDSNVYRSVSATTRSPRAGEVNGVHYYFMTEDEFLDSVGKNEFLEYVKTYNTYYGTLKKDVEDKLSEGKDVFLEIDVKGALNLRKSNIDAVYIFVAPIDISILRERLIGRGTESLEKIEERLSISSWELSKAKEYDYLLINDDLDKVCNELKTIIKASRLLIRNFDLSKYKW